MIGKGLKAKYLSLIILFLLGFSQIYAGKDVVLFKGKLFEYQEPIDLTPDTLENGKIVTPKPLKPKYIKGATAYIYTNEGDYYNESLIKNGSFSLEIPPKKVFNIFFKHEGSEPLVLSFNTENVNTSIKGEWEEFEMDFDIIPKDEELKSMKISIIEWNSNASSFSDMMINIKDSTNINYFKKLIEEDLTEAAPVCTKLIDKYFNGNNSSNQLKVEHKRRKVKGKYPVKVQMKRTLAKIKNRYETYSLQKQIIEVEMEATDVKVAFTQDPIIDSILKLKKPQIQAYVKELKANHDKNLADYERMKKAYTAYLNAERAKKGNDLVKSVEEFYPDSIPEHFHPELQALLEKFKESTNEDIIALNDPDYFKKSGSASKYTKKPGSSNEERTTMRRDRIAANSDNSSSQNSSSESNNYPNSSASNYNSDLGPPQTFDGEDVELTGSAYGEDGDYSDEIIENNPSLVSNKSYENKLEQYIRNKYGEEAANNMNLKYNPNYGSDNLNLSTGGQYGNLSSAGSNFADNPMDEELAAEKAAYAQNEFKRSFSDDFSTEMTKETSSLENESFKNQFQSSFKKTYTNTFTKAFNQPIDPKFMSTFMKEFDNKFQLGNTENFNDKFNNAFASSFAKAYYETYESEIDPVFKKEFQRSFTTLMKLNNQKKMEKEFDAAFSPSFERAFSAAIPKLIKDIHNKASLLSNVSIASQDNGFNSGTNKKGSLNYNDRILAEKTTYAKDIFTKEFPQEFKSKFEEFESTIADGSFKTNFSNTFEEKFTTLYQKAFNEPLPGSFMEDFVASFASNFSNREASENFTEEYVKAFNTSFKDAFKESFNEELPNEFETQFTSTFKTLFSPTAATENISKSFNSAFQPAFGSSFENVIPIITRINNPKLLASNTSSSNRFNNNNKTSSATSSNSKSNSNYRSTTSQEKSTYYTNALAKLNRASEAKFEETFFNNFSNQFNEKGSVNLDNSFISTFDNIFTNTINKSFKASFGRDLSSKFSQRLMLKLKTVLSNVDPSTFKTSFRKVFTSAFMEAYNEAYNNDIPDAFRTTFNRSFNELFQFDDKMPFNQTFERAFAPSFEEAFLRAIPTINEQFHGNRIKSEMDKMEREKQQAFKEQQLAVNYKDQSKQLQSTKKRQKVQLTSASSVGGKVDNPNQEFYDNNSTHAFINKLKNTYNPVERYTFKIDTNEIIVTKYRTPDGVYEVLSDKENRIQMLKNNLIVTDNVFGEDQQKFYKKLDKLSNYEFHNDQIAQIKYATRKGLIFRVQVGAVSKGNLKIFNPLKIYGDLTIDKQNMIYKYMIGEYKQLSELEEAKAQIKMSTPDAFTVAYYHGQRIHMKHALQILLGNPKYLK